MIKQLLICFASIAAVNQLRAQNDTTAKMPASDTLAVTDTVQMDSTRIAFTSLEKNPPAIGPVYKLKAAVDIPVVAVGAGWSLYAFTKIYSKPLTDEETVLSLNKNNINWFDRWAVRPYSASMDRKAYIPFNAAMPMPLLFLIPNRTRKDFFKITFLYLEAMSITGLLYTSSTYFADRYRPYVYSSGTTMEQRMNGGGKNSFFAGHVALVATSTFFGAKVLSDYFPDSKVKWLYYTIAGGVTAATAYMRLKGGMHFPTDLLVGMAQGTLTGILVPHFHKHRIVKDPNLSLAPYFNGESQGLSLVYRLK